MNAPPTIDTGRAMPLRHFATELRRLSNYPPGADMVIRAHHAAEVREPIRRAISNAAFRGTVCTMQDAALALMLADHLAGAVMPAGPEADCYSALSARALRWLTTITGTPDEALGPLLCRRDQYRARSRALPTWHCDGLTWAEASQL